jgi:hypothetical protein
MAGCWTRWGRRRTGRGRIWWGMGEGKEGGQDQGCAAGAPCDGELLVGLARASFCFFHGKGYASFGFHWIPRVRARNRGTADSYMREGRSEFPSVSRPQFRVHPNGGISALNSRFHDSKLKFLHPNTARKIHLNTLWYSSAK